MPWDRKAERTKKLTKEKIQKIKLKLKTIESRN